MLTLAGLLAGAVFELEKEGAALSALMRLLDEAVGEAKKVCTPSLHCELPDASP
jgi:hypothetical protein